MDPVDPALLVPLALVTPALVGHDLVERRLPNRLVAGAAAGVLVAWAAALASGRGAAVLDSVVAAALAAALLGALALSGGLGMGDAKLGVVLVASAALLDPVGPGVLVVVSAVAGAATAAVVRRGPVADRRAVPLGPALLAGWWAVVVARTAGGATTVLTVVAPP